MQKTNNKKLPLHDQYQVVCIDPDTCNIENQTIPFKIPEPVRDIQNLDDVRFQQERQI